MLVLHHTHHSAVMTRKEAGGERGRGRDKTSTHQLPMERHASLQFCRHLQTHRTRADGICERVGSPAITANHWAGARTFSLGINEGTAASRAVLPPPPPPPRAALSRPGAVGVWTGSHSPLWVDTRRVTRSPDTILHVRPCTLLRYLF